MYMPSCVLFLALPWSPVAAQAYSVLTAKLQVSSSLGKKARQAQCMVEWENVDESISKLWYVWSLGTLPCSISHRSHQLTTLRIKAWHYVWHKLKCDPRVIYTTQLRNGIRHYREAWTPGGTDPSFPLASLKSSGPDQRASSQFSPPRYIRRHDTYVVFDWSASTDQMAMAWHISSHVPTRDSAIRAALYCTLL